MCCLLNADAQNTFYNQRVSLFDVLPVDSTNIVFLGNSLTNGCEWHELFGDARIINRGINGDIASGICARLESIVRGKPAKIFLMAGINDVSHHISPDSIAHDVADVVDCMISQSPTTKIYLQSCLPFNESFKRWKNLEGKQQVIVELNKRLENLARDRGIVWINLYPLFCDGNDNLRRELTNDGLHLLGSGYLIWKEAIRKYIEE